MTERTTQSRRRRTSGAAHVPGAVALWFAGEPRLSGQSSVPMLALVVPGCALLPGWWRAWAEAHPSETPPAGYEWLADPDDSRQRRYARHEAAAARMMNRAQTRR